MTLLVCHATKELLKLDRAWLDMILSILPDKSQLEMVIGDIIAKGAQ